VASAAGVRVLSLLPAAELTCLDTLQTAEETVRASFETVICRGSLSKKGPDAAAP
jgi:hypothetical protein